MQRLTIELPNATPQPADFAPCKTCGGSGVLYVSEPYVVNGRVWCMADNVQKPCPDCSQECATCWGQGLVSFGVAPDDPRFGKLYPCPNCLRGQNMGTNMQKAALRGAELGEEYKSHTFATWDSLPAKYHDQKRLARAAAGLFVKAAGDPRYGGYGVNLREVYQVAGHPGANKAGDLTRNSLVFQGPVGMGKTGLAAAIVNALAPLAVGVLYVRTMRLIELVQERMNADEPPTPEHIKRRYMEAPVLVLDEFNIAKLTDWRMDTIESVIRHRHGNKLPTVVTLNADQDAAESLWGERTLSVLKAMSHWFTLGGLPMRNEGKAIESW